MMATKLRRDVQSEKQKLLSDDIRMGLAHELKRTREGVGGLSLLEISEVIKECLDPSEVKLLADDLKK